MDASCNIMSMKKYLEMQRGFYDSAALLWSLKDKDPVIGGYDRHNNHKDYDDFLFKGIDTSDLIAMDYGTGPGRNIVKFWDRFKRIDGVDIGKQNIKNAKLNLAQAGITEATLYICDGKSVPVDDETYDVFFSTICLQHICSYDIRFSILQDAYRILKLGGHICFQMGFGGKPIKDSVSDYYENMYNATHTNGRYDVSFADAEYLREDLVNKIGFETFEYDVRPSGPGDRHGCWIFVRAKK